MTRSLLVPFDSTEGAWHALHVADAYAQRAGLPIDLLVVNSPGFASQDRMELAAAAKRLQAVVGELLVVAGDDVAEEVLASLIERPDATGWMATHGRSRLAGLVLGSTAEAVVRGSERPMFLVGPQASVAPMWGPVLVCVDTSGSPIAFFSAACEWARRLDCPVRLVTVEEDEASREGSRLLDGLAEECRAGGVDPEVEVLSGRPAEEIARCASSHAAALIAMPTHARTGVRRAVLGSVTMAVVHAAPCPVLVAAFP